MYEKSEEKTVCVFLCESDSPAVDNGGAVAPVRTLRKAHEQPLYF